MSRQSGDNASSEPRAGSDRAQTTVATPPAANAPGVAMSGVQTLGCLGATASVGFGLLNLVFGWLERSTIWLMLLVGLVLIIVANIIEAIHRARMTPEALAALDANRAAADAAYRARRRAHADDRARQREVQQAAVLEAQRVAARESATRAEAMAAEQKGLAVRRAAADAAVYQRLIAVIERHAGALATERRKGVERDAYGAVLTDEPWRIERAYFIRTQLAPTESDLLALQRYFQQEEGARVPGLVNVAARLETVVLERELDRVLSVGGAAGQAHAMSPAEFEHRCATVFEAAGFTVTRCGGSGDQGADLIAVRGPARVVVQCKRYTGAVGTGAVQEVLAARTFYHATAAWVVTTGHFTPGARTLAERAHIALLHVDLLGAEAHRLSASLDTPA